MEYYPWESYYATDVSERQRQISTFGRLLHDLQSGEEKIALLLEEMNEVCPLCDDLLAGITSEREREALLFRIESTLALLRVQSTPIVS